MIVPRLRIMPNRRRAKKSEQGEDPVEAALSAAEAALENQRIGRLQLRVAALCADSDDAARAY